ncbi:hypothetical protein IL992_22235 [Microbispora sp. NEAU-D428]|uniref:hypothetical protein n=1 Tax=Microbispora sitophila TaxID=2771537 RepID=UPI0018672B52|nr:hypothetical protein [Microbispora sitophila]MBE3011896.1 hypothetical protein [Microbispora sitophila]
MSLEFGMVRGLRIEQAGDFGARAGSDFEGVPHEVIGDMSHFTVKAGDMNYGFTAEYVALTAE